MGENSGHGGVKRKEKKSEKGGEIELKRERFREKSFTLPRVKKQSQKSH